MQDFHIAHIMDVNTFLQTNDESLEEEEEEKKPIEHSVRRSCDRDCLPIDLISQPKWYWQTNTNRFLFLF